VGSGVQAVGRPPTSPDSTQRDRLTQDSDTPKRSRRTTATRKSAAVLTADERAAMKELAAERKAQARGEDGESAVLAKIAEIPEADRSMAERIQAIVTAAAPSLTARTWYGMPAYAKDGKVICFFQSAAKFKARYATLGFSPNANLDDGNMFPTYFALKKLSASEEKKITTLVKTAVS
jgi:hypothetical protein